MSGIVYLIGAGPGDFKLITVKGRECIEKADVIVYDYLADETLLRWARPDAEIIYAGKQCRNHTLHQYEINELLVDRGLKGKVVARLKGGDPLVFGRGGEEALALVEAGVPFEFVPGVTSAISAPAYAGIPVTQRAMATSFAVVTGHEDPTKSVSGIHWEGLATAVDTLCFVMGIGNLPIISAKLMANGRSPKTPVAVIRWGTKSTQETLVSDLEHVADDVEKAGLKAPALIVAHVPEKMFDRGHDSAHFCLAYAELFAPSLGLGTCWSGFAEYCGQYDWEPFLKELNLPEGRKVGGAIMVGYPQYQYRYMPNRRPLDVTFDED